VISANGEELAEIERRNENASSPDTIWYSVDDYSIQRYFSNRTILDPSSYSYSIVSTIAEYTPSIPYVNIYGRLVKCRSEESSSILAFSSEYVLSRAEQDTLYGDIALTDFYRSDVDGGFSCNTAEFISYVSNSELQRERYIIHNETQVYSVAAEAISSHFHEATHQHNRNGFLNAKHHLTSSFGSDSLLSFSESSAAELQRLDQDACIDIDRWITLNAPAGELIWLIGGHSDSLTSREVTFARTSSLERNLLNEFGECISESTHDFPRVLNQWESVFESDRVQQDTIAYNKNIFMYVHPDTTIANPEIRRGLIFMVPVAGKLACSLYVGSTPSLEEFAWASFDAAFITGSILYARYVPGPLINGPADDLADDVADDIIRAASESGISETAVQRPSTQALRSVLESAGRESGPGQIHHIVSLRDNAATVSRQILAKYGVDLNSVDNLVPLTNHLGRHTAEYYRTVEGILRQAASRADVIEALQIISRGLKTGDIAL